MLHKTRARPCHGNTDKCGKDSSCNPSISLCLKILHFYVQNDKLIFPITIQHGIIPIGIDEEGFAMHAKHRFLITLFLLLTLSTIASAESTPFFPCVLNHSYESSQYEEYVELDLKKWYRSDIDNWVDDDLMVKSGSAIVLNHSILIIDLHFSGSFDYESNDTHVPNEITLCNRDPNVTDDSGTPEWQVTIFPDQDDPYAFHYFGTFNWTMAGIHMFGRYLAFEGDLEPDSCFSLLIAVY